jgi:hypothetical protein
VTCTDGCPRNGITTLFGPASVVGSMPSREGTAAAPITTGVFAAGMAAQEVAQYGLEIWSSLALVGGLSAIAVGLGVLTDGRGVDGDDDLDGSHDWTTVALAGLALTCLAVGAGIALA